MAGDVTTRITIDGDSRQAVAALEDVADAADDAEQAVDVLEDVDIDIDARSALDELDALIARADDLETDLEQIDDIDVSPTVDTAGIDQGVKSVDGLGDTAERAAPALRGVTDELGESSGAAGTMGQAALDAGEAVQIMGAKAGISADKMARIQTVAGQGAIAVAGAAYLYSEFSKAAEQAAEAIKLAEGAIESINEKDWAKGAEQLIEAFPEVLDMFDEWGVSADDQYRILTAGTDNYFQSLAELTGKYGELTVAEQAVLGLAVERWEEVKNAADETAGRVDEFSNAVRRAEDPLGHLEDDGVEAFGAIDLAIAESVTAIDGWKSDLDIWDETRAMNEALEEWAADTETSSEAAQLAVLSWIAVMDEAVAEPYVAELRAAFEAGDIEEIYRIRRAIQQPMASTLFVTGVYQPPPNLGSVDDHPYVAAPASSQRGAMNVTVNTSAAQSGPDLVTQLERWQRVNGR
jgi:hypothetical protein